MAQNGTTDERLVRLETASEFHSFVAGKVASIDDSLVTLNERQADDSKELEKLRPKVDELARKVDANGVTLAAIATALGVVETIAARGSKAEQFLEDAAQQGLGIARANAIRRRRASDGWQKTAAQVLVLIATAAAAAFAGGRAAQNPSAHGVTLPVPATPPSGPFVLPLP